MDHAGDVIQCTDGHASKMEALAPNPPLLNELNFFSCRGKPEGCNPACRTSTENSYHRDFPKIIIRLVFLMKSYRKSSCNTRVSDFF
jgi:hypothetical protein